MNLTCTSPVCRGYTEFHQIVGALSKIPYLCLEHSENRYNNNASGNLVLSTNNNKSRWSRGVNGMTGDQEVLSWISRSGQKCFCDGVARRARLAVGPGCHI